MNFESITKSERFCAQSSTMLPKYYAYVPVELNGGVRPPTMGDSFVNSETFKVVLSPENCFSSLFRFTRETMRLSIS